MCMWEIYTLGEYLHSWQQYRDDNYLLNYTCNCVVVVGLHIKPLWVKSFMLRQIQIRENRGETKVSSDSSFTDACKRVSAWYNKPFMGIINEVCIIMNTAAHGIIKKIQY